MNFSIRPGVADDLDGLERLYNDINDYLAVTTNYPGWKKGIYPVRENAALGIEQGCLFAVTANNKIMGSFILNHEPEPAYHKAQWHKDLDYGQVLVIYTFAVHPDYWKQGAGQAMLQFAAEYGSKTKMQSLRLDVYEKNIPAVRLYEKSGFEYVATVDLGLGEYGLDRFKLYEKLL